MNKKAIEAICLLVFFISSISFLRGASYFPALSLDVQNPDYKQAKELKSYMIQTRQKIENLWKPGNMVLDARNRFFKNTVIFFRIVSTGALVENKLLSSSGNQEADSQAMKALLAAMPFEAPPSLKEKQVIITATFYNSELFRLYGESRREKAVVPELSPNKIENGIDGSDFSVHGVNPNGVNHSTNQITHQPEFQIPQRYAPYSALPAYALDPSFKLGDLSYKHIRLGIPLEDFRRISLSGLADEKYPQPDGVRFSNDSGFDKPYSSDPKIIVGKFYGKYGECYVGLATVQSEAEFKFIKACDVERLGQIDFTLDSDYYIFVRDGLAKKYGKPAQQIQKTVQNRMGAKFTDEILIWNVGNCEIKTYRFMPDLTKSHVIYTFIPLKNSLREIQGLDKDPSKDL